MEDAIAIIAGRYSEQQLSKVHEILLDFEDELKKRGEGRNALAAFDMVQRYIEQAVNHNA